MSEESAVKYLDVDSTYRNRNNYPNPYDFVIPYSFPNKGSTSLGFFDAVLDSSPYTGSPTLQPGQLVTGISFMNLLTSTIDITLDTQETTIDNFYINSTLQIGTEFRSITNFNGLTKVCSVSQPFFSIPPPGTVYYIRKVQTYFDSDVSIYRYNQLSNTTDQLSLLTASPSPIKDFYKGSYIRFSNGTHVGETALITNYEPFSETTTWSQSSNQGSNTFIGTTSDQGFSFRNSISGVCESIILNIASFGTRTLNIYIREGSGINGILLGSENFVLSNSSQTDVTFYFTNIINVLSGSFYTILLQDITGNNNGYINLFGITPGVGLSTFNLPVYPKVSVLISQPPSQCWIQPDKFGSTNYISVNTSDTFEFIPSVSTILNSISITIISFETVSSGRSLLMTILDPTSTIIFQGTFQILDTPQTPTITSLTLTSIVNVTIGDTFTLILQDTTAGGYSTGFINMFGIIPTIGYVTSTSVYPQIDFLSGGSGFVQNTKIIGSSALNPSLQGYSSALSRDGNTLAIGGQGDNGDIGAVWIYIRSGGVWTQQDKLVGTGNIGSSKQGSSLSLSDDGNTLSIGGSADDSGNGAVWIFTRTGGVWTQQDKLIGTGNIGFANQGVSVSLSSNGDIVAIGGLSDDSGNGAVWIFTRTSGVWSQYQKIVGTGNFGFANQGVSVSLSGDGSTLAFGGNFDSGGTGAVWVFVLIGGVWGQQNLISASSASPTAYQGSSVSLSDNGNVLVYGAPFDGSGGICYSINRTGPGVWDLPSIMGSVFPVTNLGNSISISGDGSIAIAGATISSIFNPDAGSSVVFLNNAGTWTASQNLIGTGNIGNGNQGFSVSISKNNSTISMGAPLDNSNSGATWIFDQSSSSIFSQSLNPVKSSVVSTILEQGFEFTSSITGKLSDLTLSLTSFESLLSGRTLNVKILNNFGLGGSIVYTGSVIIPNNSVQTSYVIPINSGNLINGNVYTLVLEDTTINGTLNGSLYIYGIDPNGTFYVLNISTYPKLSITASPSITSFTQQLNPTVSDIVSTTSNQGFLFSPVFTGNIINIILSLTSFDITGIRNLSISILDGSGLGGSVLYTTSVNISNVLTRTNYPINLISSTPLTLSQNYTISIMDVSPGGTSTGDITLYGITPASPFISYNISVYPQIIMKIPSFIITISPPKLLTGFNNPPITSFTMFGPPGPDTIEFNSQAHENATTLFQNGVQAHSAHYYKIGLKYLVIPNQILNVSRGGRLDNYPYIYVQIYNDGNRGALNVMTSDNPNASLAVFKCPVDKNLYDRPTSFFTLKTPNKDQIVKFRPDQNIRVTLTLPDGTIISNQLVDNTTPLFPNPLLQVNALFTLLPIDKYDHTPN
ncbi:MAG: hypothetical protein PHG66_04960 [Candidatus Colwellbacteria bacterium]|nr:hypothetical protein [Candidatus Colwellbacteria bacterium]